MTSPQNIEKNLKRQQIIVAAEALFSERSYGNTKISDIAKKAGVGIGTFYRYFPDKEAVLLELLESLTVNIKNNLKQIRVGIESLSPLEHIARIRKTFEIVFHELLSRPRIVLTLLRSGFGASEKVNELLWSVLEEIVDDLVVTISRVESVGLIQVNEKKSLCHCIAGMVMQLVHKIIVEDTPSKEEAVNLCTRLTVGMLSSFASEEILKELSPIYLMLFPQNNEHSFSEKIDGSDTTERSISHTGK